PMQVRLFGWFRAEIDRRPIEWVRRRDRQIFKYIALQPGGSVSRAELGKLFWPDAEKHLVAQSLRTACSNIRKAIAQLVGFDRVEAYFRAGDDLAVDLDNVIIDVNGFLAHSNDGDEQYDRGEVRAAYAHYRSAGRLYRGNLLLGDVHESWVGPLAASLEQRHVTVLERLSEIASELDYQPTTETELPIASGS
ncbi:MAG: BTAD domain-containing putative transcriptional regulator, partial [Candidatus Cybelea sp.]